MMHPNHDLARSIRQLADLLVTRELNDDIRAKAQTLLRETVEMLDSTPTRDLPTRLAAFDAQMRVSDVVPDGASMSTFSASPYSGDANGLSPDVQMVRDGAGLRATVVLGDALEGRPGRAHGGATAAVFDDVMGAVQRIVEPNGYTKKLTVHYRRPAPTTEVMEIRAWLADEDERTFTAHAEAMHDGKVVATGEAVFAKIDPSTFFGASQH